MLDFPRSGPIYIRTYMYMYVLPCAVAEVASSVFWRTPFSSLCNYRQLTEFYVLHVETATPTNHQGSSSNLSEKVRTSYSESHDIASESHDKLYWYSEWCYWYDSHMTWAYHHATTMWCGVYWVCDVWLVCVLCECVLCASVWSVDGECVLCG